MSSFPLTLEQLVERENYLLAELTLGKGDPEKLKDELAVLGSIKAELQGQKFLENEIVRRKVQSGERMHSRLCFRAG